MKIIKINNNRPDLKIIKAAARVLKAGGVVIYPTDTAYALGGIFNNAKAVQKILAIKKRNDKKFTIIAANLSQFKKFFKPDIFSYNLAKKYWPGPLSIVVSARYAVRVPQNAIASLLSAKTGKPLIATSANISGLDTPYDVKTILEQFGSQKKLPDLILDAGRLKKNKPSTIVKVKNEKMLIIRPGSVKLSI